MTTALILAAIAIGALILLVIWYPYSKRKKKTALNPYIQEDGYYMMEHPPKPFIPADPFSPLYTYMSQIKDDDVTVSFLEGDDGPTGQPYEVITNPPVIIDMRQNEDSYSGGSD